MKSVFELAVFIRHIEAISDGLVQDKLQMPHILVAGKASFGLDPLGQQDDVAENEKVAFDRTVSGFIRKL